MEKARSGSLYRAIRGMRHGRLHRALHVPEDKTIPQAKLSAASHSSNPTLVHMANFAKTLKGLKK